jgi:uncharacterized membrane protein (DUF2068 family)
MDAAIMKAHSLVNMGSGGYRVTDLTKTELADVQSRYFRLFVPVKHSSNRLPTSLPEFHTQRHTAILSDSPVTAAAHVGGHWSDHNLAAITQVAACNFRCSYCYVDFRHLAGHDSLPVTGERLVEEFTSLRNRLAAEGRRLSILRISGGEPLLAPDLVGEIYETMDKRDLLRECLLKVESNMSALRHAWTLMSPAGQRRLRAAATGIAVHATLHVRPGHRHWSDIHAGLCQAIYLGLNVYPSIGGTDWTDENLSALFDELEAVARGLAKRLAVRPFNLAYAERYARRSRPASVTSDRPPSLRWDDILRARTGHGYLDRPRHEVSLA